MLGSQHTHSNSSTLPAVFAVNMDGIRKVGQEIKRQRPKEALIPLMPDPAPVSYRSWVEHTTSSRTPSAKASVRMSMASCFGAKSGHDYRRSKPQWRLP
jgi:hypothetical protein